MLVSMVLLPAASLLLSEQQTLVPSSAEVPLRLRSSRVAAPADPARVKVQVRTPEKMAHVRPDASGGDGVFPQKPWEIMKINYFY